ncbi:MAG: alkaline phosphatase D family protein [bacterium]|nr:alkaline phosphatase D family protein [bacterium]
MRPRASPARPPTSASHAAAPFPTGVLAGDRRRAITLVARVDGVPDGGRIGVEVARDPGFAQVIARRRVPVRADAAFVARAEVASPRLRGDAPFWYRFFTRDVASPVGRFKLRPAPAATAPLRLAWFSCQGWPAGYFGAHAAMAAEDLDVALSLGDYVYELTDDRGPRVDTIGPDGDGFAQTLDEYRAKYRLYQSDADLRAMHAAHAFLAIWDNHELADDSPGHVQGKPIRVPLATRMAYGKRAFFEALPMRRAHLDAFHLYRSIRLGAHVELFLLDMHSYADPPTQGTYLGARQLGWLLRGLSRSRATWKIVASTTVVAGTDLTPGNPINLGQWDGYAAERRTIMEHVLRERITGVVTLSGDLHTFIAGQVTTTGRADGTPAAVDFTGGAITSQGLLDTWPPRPDRETLAAQLEAQGRAVNPHLAFLDLLAKGYGRLEADARELRVTFRAVGTVLEPSSPVRDLVRFRVRPDAPVIETLA